MIIIIDDWHVVNTDYVVKIEGDSESIFITYSDGNKQQIKGESARMKQIQDQIRVEVDIRNDIYTRERLRYKEDILEKENDKLKKVNEELTEKVSWVAGLAEMKIEDIKEIAQTRKLTVSDLEITLRSENCLLGEDIRTVDDLITKSEHELLCIPNLGRKSLLEIKEVLEARGLKLREGY